MAEQEAINTLQKLLGKQNRWDDGTFYTSIVPGTNRFPPLSTCPSTELLVNLVSTELKKIPEIILQDDCNTEIGNGERVKSDD